VCFTLRYAYVSTHQFNNLWIWPDRRLNPWSTRLRVYHSIIPLMWLFIYKLRNGIHENMPQIWYIRLHQLFTFIPERHEVIKTRNICLILRYQGKKIKHILRHLHWISISCIRSYTNSNRRSSGRDHMVIGFSTTCPISAYNH
jgi:hypothetical protein